jgi:hypothetical protein
MTKKLFLFTLLAQKSRLASLSINQALMNEIATHHLSASNPTFRSSRNETDLFITEK